MKQEPTSVNDSFIDELRESGPIENTLVSKFGLYKAIEVDRYIAHLQDQLSGTEAVYQDRFEEMRTSLLGMTRERDEKLAQIRNLEAKLAESIDLEKVLSEKGLVSLSATEIEEIKAENMRLNQKIEQLMVNVSENTDKALIIEDLHRAQSQLETRTAAVAALERELSLSLSSMTVMQTTLDEHIQQIDFLSKDRDKVLEKFTSLSEAYSKLDETLQIRNLETSELRVRTETLEKSKQEMMAEINVLRDRYQSKNEESSQLEHRLATQQQAAADFQLQLDTLRLQLTNLTDALAQSRSQYQLLEAQYQIGQDLVNKLMIEKSSLESEIKNQKQRFEFQREAMSTRFQSILNSQNEFMKKLQENFNASVNYMENLTETGLRGFNEDNR